MRKFSMIAGVASLAFLGFASQLSAEEKLIYGFEDDDKAAFKNEKNLSEPLKVVEGFATEGKKSLQMTYKGASSTARPEFQIGKLKAFDGAKKIMIDYTAKDVTPKTKIRLKIKDGDKAIATTDESVADKGTITVDLAGSTKIDTFMVKIDNAKDGQINFDNIRIEK